MMVEHRPASVTAAQVQVRLQDIRELVRLGDTDEAKKEMIQLYADVLHTIAYAPPIADKDGMKRLAYAALDAHDMVERGH